MPKKPSSICVVQCPSPTERRTHDTSYSSKSSHCCSNATLQAPNVYRGRFWPRHHFWNSRSHPVIQIYNACMSLLTRSSSDVSVRLFSVPPHADCGLQICACRFGLATLDGKFGGAIVTQRAFPTRKRLGWGTRQFQANLRRHLFPSVFRACKQCPLRESYWWDGFCAVRFG